MTARWEEAYDAQIDLYRQASGPFGAAVIEQFGKLRMGDEDDDLARDNPAIYDSLGAVVRDIAFNADPFWVDPDMMTVWEAAVPTFAREALLETDILAPFGCLLLPRPYYILDKHDKRTAFRLIQWATVPLHVQGREDPHFKATGTGVLFLLWSNVDDDDDYWPDPEAVAEAKNHGMRWSLLHVMAMPCTNETFRVTYKDARPPGDVDPRDIARPIQALFRLMSQYIAVRTEARPSSPFRKRWAKANLTERRVTVVRLRRPDSPPREGDPRVVDWTHRWIVGGHWRAQWYPSESVHRQIWISPYVKGPEEKPLEVNKVRVFELVR